MKTVLQILVAIALGIAIVNCGPSTTASVSAHAEAIGGPPGVSCYVIVSGDRLIGGNCIR